MRIYYHLSAYISHRLAGLAYIACLERLGHSVLREPQEPDSADMAIVHDDPLVFPQIFSRRPALARMRTVGYCVWENEQLSPLYVQPLQLVNEVWTPSVFSQKSMAAHHNRVFVLPHVVRRCAPGRDDMARMAALLGKNSANRQEPFRFFSIVDSINPRKNLKGLLAAFAAVRSSLAPKPLLVLKQYRASFDLSGLDGVISIDADLSEGEMAALHVLCDAYVSAHHCEGWGLGLSEAMAYGRPVIATAYSGNMDFMNAANSLPVPYTLVPVSDEMIARQPLFTRDMHWAEPDANALVAAMKRAAEKRLPPELPANAARITRDFGPDNIAARLQALLTQEPAPA